MLLRIIMVMLIVAILLPVLGWLDTSLRPAPLACVNREDRERVRKITHEAIEEAYHNQVVRLFEVWMRDLTDQPDRAHKGLDTAIKAYVQSRADADAWTPKEC